jgi:hypothetical protein
MRTAHKLLSKILSTFQLNSNMQIFDLVKLDFRHVPKFEFGISRHWFLRYVEVKSRRYVNFSYVPRVKIPTGHYSQ